MDLMVIEVHGVPDILPHGQMVDKLKIHFLRRSNHGADVLIVIYPTSIREQAYVVFESARDFSVLEHPHVLELEKKYYPLQVMQAHLSEVDMKAETMVNMNKFQRPSDVLQIIHSHGFEVTEPSRDHFLLKGSFLRLKLLHTQLMQILARDIQPHRRSYSALPKDYTSSYVSSTVLNGPEPRAVPNSTSKYGGVIGNDIQAEMWNSLAGASQNNLTIPKPTSLVYVDSASGASPSLSCSCDDSLASLPCSSCQWSSCSRNKVSFLVDTDILTYALTHKQDHFDNIEKAYGTKMSSKDYIGFTMVTFWGKNCKNAEACLLDLIQQISPFLRTQIIHLEKYSDKQQSQVFERIQQSKYLNRDVLIKQDGDIVKVVGTSTRSFEIMQMLLGQDVESQTHGHRGRNVDRNSVHRRSSSVPRQFRLSGLKKTEQGCSHVPERQFSVTKEYSPSQYQEESQTGGTLKAFGCSQHSPNEQAMKQRSSSDIRKNNMVTLNQQYDEVLPSSGETKSKGQMPNIKKTLCKNINISNIKSKQNTKNVYI